MPTASPALVRSFLRIVEGHNPQPTMRIRKSQSEDTSTKVVENEAEMVVAAFRFQVHAHCFTSVGGVVFAHLRRSQSAAYHWD